MNLRSIVAFLLLGLTACSVRNDLEMKNRSLNQETYLGQNPPGLIPELFTPELIQKGHRAASCSLSPDLKEFYFRRRGGKYKKNALILIKYDDNRWAESIVSEHSRAPFVSNDGKTMYLGSNYRTRLDSIWSEEKSLGDPFKEYRIMRLTASVNGTCYFDEAGETAPLRYARLINGVYEKPKTLDLDVGVWNAHPFIALDESYIIWDDQRASGYGSSDLYISFRQKDDSWGPAVNLGEQVNSSFEDAFGSVSPDGKYFFFHRSYDSDKADIFWVDASFIEALRNEDI